MTGKQLVLEALRGQKTQRAPWVPFVGSHGAYLLGKGADEYLRSADLIVEALEKAKDQYSADGLPIVFDLQMEAEVLGCDLHWPDDGPPSVSSHPLDGELDLTNLTKFDITAGRFPMAMEATRRVSESIGESTALYGLICGPFTLAMHLMGNELFLEMYDDEDGVKALVDHCGTICQEVASAYLENGCDVIAVVDPMLSQISPEHLEQFVSPALNATFDHVHDKGGLASLFVCGDATRNLEVMCKTSCDNISVDENVDLENLLSIARENNTSVGGNMKLTLVLLLGKEDDAKVDALRCLDLGDSTGFILAPGCDLPFNTPPENVAAAGKIATDEYARETARSLSVEFSDDFSDIQLPDYENEDEVILDVVTLDSLSCAPCQYMMIAAEKAAEESGIRVSVREHKIKVREGIGMFVKLGLSNLPTICIDGKAEFISTIPDKKTLVKSILKAADLKVSTTVG